ncbi:hypothetical protein MMPV_007125 [Pyropia vietnamensis]
MVLKKALKSKSYHKRYQVKWRRRREGKTDYYARKRLITQDKRKYNSPKYRLVVRFSNRDIVCQIVAAKLIGDEVLCAAYAHELPRYGIKLGLTNYAAAYAVGLLIARRMLSKLGLAETYVGKQEVDGEMYEIEQEGNRRPFKALLDVGLSSTTTGKKVFAVMKGAVDGGMNVPHNEKRFPAWTKDEGFSPEELKKRILGIHVSEFMEELEEEDPDKFKVQFSRYIAAGIKAEDLEDIYTNAHEAIRADPSFTKKEKTTTEHKKWNKPKISHEQRKQNVRDKIQAAMEAAAEDDE